MIDCVFCHLNKKEILFENELALAFFDSFPVSKGHILIIPKRHCEHYFELNKDEVVAIFELSLKVRQYLDDKYHPDGYNIGFNVLEAGGQSVMHTHLHIIPRYKGDVAHPRGGIRKILKKDF